MLLALLGTLGTAKFIFSLSKMVLQTFILPGQSLKNYGAQKGAWALVTGATDGIGREFARQLAKAGFNIVLVSRSSEKLAAAANEIEGEYKVSSKIYSIDFSKADVKAFDGLAETINGLDISVLVNNVGKSHDLPVYFHETEQQEIDDILQININSTLRITRIVLPSLLARKKGLILNIGSFAAAVPSAMLATYAGSKGFLATWSQALGEELKHKGITVQLINTFFVVSAMSKIRKPSVSTPLPSAYVASVLKTIGNPCGASGRPYVSTPYWSHAVADWVMGQADWMSGYMSYSHNLHIAIRKRGLKKRELKATKTQ